MNLFTRRTVLFTGVALLLKSPAVFGNVLHCCRCRSHGSCKKVCRLVREEKKVEIICWGGKCEDFCLPGPSKKGCKHCEEVCATCDACSKDGVSATPKTFVWYDWFPGCANDIRTKKKLMKKVVTKRVPSYKWVVEDLCGDCRRDCISLVVPLDAEIPEPPPHAEPIAFVRLQTLSTSDE